MVESKHRKKKMHQCRGRRKDSKDGDHRVPACDEFSFSELRKASKIYQTYADEHPGKKVPIDLFIVGLSCSKAKAALFVSAAEFRYKMLAKGLA